MILRVNQCVQILGAWSAGVPIRLSYSKLTLARISYGRLRMESTPVYIVSFLPTESTPIQQTIAKSDMHEATSKHKATWRNLDRVEHNCQKAADGGDKDSKKRLLTIMEWSFSGADPFDRCWARSYLARDGHPHVSRSAESRTYKRKINRSIRRKA